MSPIAKLISQRDKFLNKNKRAKWEIKQAAPSNLSSPPALQNISIRKLTILSCKHIIKHQSQNYEVSFYLRGSDGENFTSRYNVIKE